MLKCVGFRIALVSGAAVTLMAVGCALEDPTAVSQADLISLVVEPAAIRADGVDRTSVTAMLRSDTQDTVTITFGTDRGRFLGGEGTDQQQVKVKAQANEAFATLVSDNIAGFVQVTANTRNFVATETVEFMRVAPTELVLSADRTATKADGNSTISLTAVLTLEPDSGTVTTGTRVTFRAIGSDGTEVPALERRGESDSTGRVATSLVSTVAGSFMIRAVADDTPAAVDSVVVTFN